MDIDALRRRIAELDREIMDTAGERMEVAKKIGAWKIRHDREIRDPGVEGKVIERYVSAGKDNGVSPRTSRDMAVALIREAVDVQAALPRKGEGKDVLILGGTGKMGRWLAGFLEGNGHRVTAVGSGGPPLEELVPGQDVIIISTPISSIGGVLEELNEISPDSLIFDLSSLKSPFIDQLKSMAQSMRICSVHPMFGPSIPSLYDRNVIFCDCGNEEAVNEAMSLFNGHGANLTRLPVEEHDRRMSYVLGMSHAINIAFFTALADSGLSFDELNEAASTTFSKMVEGAAEVARENPLLYYEIQNLNETAKVTWSRFMDAVDKVMDASLDDEPDKFVEIMERGRVFFDAQSR